MLTKHIADLERLRSWRAAHPERCRLAHRAAQARYTAKRRLACFNCVLPDCEPENSICPFFRDVERMRE